MKLLVDTHVWLWMLTAPERMNQAARDAIVDPANEVIVSVASAWEVAIKHALGKLPLHAPPARLVEISVTMLAVNVLPIALDHALAAAALPPPSSRSIRSHARGASSARWLDARYGG
ncbi:MAG TPA: type II toxin-antitoxin system VapC family toxin [Kofleriaceae bacterium]